MPLDAIKGERRAVVRDVEHGKPFPLAPGCHCLLQSAPRQLGQHRAHREISFFRNRLTVSRISSSMFNVVLLPEKPLQ